MPKSERDHTKTHRRVKWFWVANLPVVALIFFTLPEKFLVLYLAFISVYANIAGHWSAEEASPEDS